MCQRGPHAIITAFPALMSHPNQSPPPPPGSEAVRSSAARGRTFDAGDLVSGRFRVVRFIARGGMGEVYEAEDLELGERIAIKTIREDIAEDERVNQRFRREVQLARKITHPNICRIFDLFQHQFAGPREGAPPVLFVTMELLSGETLAQRLKRDGPMTAEQARPIVAQMAAALSAAHAADIVHRDFKSSNVVLLPPARPWDPPRAVVTDFGLAYSVSDSTKGVTLSGSGDLLGTPDYMAPEQVEGGPVTPATDVYALGIVLYETVTGVRPFVGDTPIASALRRVAGPPAKPPRELAPNLPPAWDAAIMTCLARLPSRRFPDASFVLQALDPSGTHARVTPEIPRRLVIAALTVLAIAGVGIAWRVWNPFHGLRARGRHARPRCRAGERVHEPSRDCGAGLPEPRQPAGRPVAVDGAVRDGDDRAGRRRGRAHGAGRKRQPHEDRAGARRRRRLRAGNAGADSREPRHRSGGVRVVCHRGRRRRRLAARGHPPPGLAPGADALGRQRKWPRGRTAGPGVAGRSPAAAAARRQRGRRAGACWSRCARRSPRRRMRGGSTPRAWRGCASSTRSARGAFWSGPSRPMRCSRWRTRRWRAPGPRSATTPALARRRSARSSCRPGLARAERLQVEGTFREMDTAWPEAIEIWRTLAELLPRRHRARAAAGQRADRVGRSPRRCRDHRSLPRSVIRRSRIRGSSWRKRPPTRRCRISRRWRRPPDRPLPRPSGRARSWWWRRRGSGRAAPCSGRVDGTKPAGSSNRHGRSTPRLAIAPASRVRSTTSRPPSPTVPTRGAPRPCMKKVSRSRAPSGSRTWWRAS